MHIQHWKCQNCSLFVYKYIYRHMINNEPTHFELRSLSGSASIDMSSATLAFVYASPYLSKHSRVFITW